jgi:hypothetical protein
VIYFVSVSNDTSGKHTVFHITMSAHSQMKLKIQCQELKSKDWEIVKQMKELGVPGMDEVVAAFVKEKCVYLIPSNN